MAGLPQLSRLQQLPLRTVWAHEAAVFTPWLAQPENLQLLAEALGFPELEVVQIEQSVSEFSCDIVVRSPINGAIIAIENQIEPSDHKHLGQVLTYVAGTEASAVVWVAERFTDGHRVALEWLNRKTSDDVSFFGVQLEAWQIGDSSPAPRFSVIIRPNEWQRETKARVQRSEAQAADAGYTAYWSAFDPVATAHGVHRTGKVPANTNYYHQVEGLQDVCAVGTVAASSGAVGAYVGAYRPDATEIASRMAGEMEAISRELGQDVKLSVQRDRVIHFVVERLKADFADQGDWARQHEYMARNMAALLRSLEPRFSALGMEQLLSPTTPGVQD